jgi:uroporphyrinogen III methyltransferase/synthase
MVYLVGAGPGDPGLLTLKGRDCLRRADLVLYDGLVNPLLLRHTSAHAERTCRTAGPDGRMLPQDQINARLIEAAHAGKTVVRLKGGDPFIFGRGSEEAAALAAEGIPFEVVPGVTAATAAGAYAGISLTHRAMASSVMFVTGHEDPTKTDSSIDYDLLARYEGTIVFYMGLHRLETIAKSLLESGMQPDVPACVISRATTPLQRTVSAPLNQLVGTVRSAELHAPSLIIVGDCVQQREAIAWFERKPLFGRSIGITRPAAQAGPAIERCLELGARPILMPTIAIGPPEDWSPVDEAIARIGDYDWLIFTSANGVRGLCDRLWELGRDARTFGTAKIAAIGPATVDVLAEYQLRADLVPETSRAEAMAEALKPHVDGKRILWAGANRGREVLPRELTAAGAAVERVVVYHNDDVAELSPEAMEAISAGRLDWIGLSSPSIARNLKKLLPAEFASRLGGDIRLASISPVTSAAASEQGMPIVVEAGRFSWDGLFDAIVEAEQGV